MSSAILEIDFSDRSLNFLELRRHALRGGLVHLRQVFFPELLRNLREQLLRWSQTTEPQDPKIQYPKDKRNLHLHVFNATNQNDLPTLDYKNDRTLIDVYNYRIGDFRAEEVNIHVPLAQEVCPRLFDLYGVISGNRDLVHGAPYGEKNLFLEVAQYHGNGGYIGPHTHERNFANGQALSMILMMAQKSVDFDSGGLFVDCAGETLDLTDSFNCGDLILFRMDLCHWVSPVKCNSHQMRAAVHGRWTATLFYY